jgi:glycosyltransferase involved in cell wall biosynthesis
MRDNPTRILHVVGSLNRGGIETWLYQAVARLPRERYRSDFCTYRSERGAYATELEHCGCEFHYIPLGWSPVRMLCFAKRFRRLLREGRYDVVHCHGLLLVGFILYLAWLEKTPVRIAHAHNTDRKTGGMLSAANRLGLLLNRVLARALSTQGVGCSAEAGAALFGGRWQEDTKYRLIHCGIDLKPFQAAKGLNSQRTALGIGPDAKVIGHVGSFSIAKNHRFLVEVAAHVFRRRADVMLLLVGDGALRRLIEQSCADLGIGSRVIFAGVSSCVPELMRSAMDVFVMPSLHEGLPLVLLEAQAAGLPCLVSDVVAHEAMVSDGSIRFMPLSAGLEAWGSAVLSLLASSTERRNLLGGMQDGDFNAVVSAKKLGDLYDAACAGGAVSTGF